ncbi:MAG: SUMF1/EgtB/PvdO family nonheme iron enzyme [Deltaproteobacteria bacterium]|nr:SUMF1/EgtB/PvdO family nonheme iron enzyme [Deltaproteobacteria bacterium]
MRLAGATIAIAGLALLPVGCKHTDKAATAEAKKGGARKPAAVADASRATAPSTGALKVPDGGLPAADDSARPPAFPSRLEVDVPRPSFPSPKAGQMIKVAAGTLLVGSAPDDNLRDQTAEVDLVPSPMTPFEIDALPSPNDPRQPFKTGVSQAEAQSLCAAGGKRLCTEIEWERACKGDAERRFPTSNRYDPTAYPQEQPWQPASPLGVFAMGRLAEWTASPWGDEPDQVGRVAVRGWAEGEDARPDRGRRCARRWHRTPEIAEPTLGFRCCRGEPNKAKVVIEGPRPPISLYTNMKPDKFARVIRDIPELAAVHDNPRMFSDADIRAVLAKRESNRDELTEKGVHFEWKPLRWIPKQGMELWVAVGRSDRHSFVVALHETVDNEKYVHASSLVLWNQPLPLALAYKEGHRGQLFWLPCWGCRDGGTIEFDEAKNEVIITHKW